MKKITKKELKTILEQHKLWLDSNEKEGKCVDLSGANLSGANLTCVDLSGADLSGADLRCADLSGANLTSANLSYANLSYANLSYANLSGANLTSANLRCANLTSANLTSANLRGVDLRRSDLFYTNLTDAVLTGADLYGANLTGADLTRAYLYRADLTNADLTNTIIDEKEQCRKGIVLTEPMIGYKKARGGKIITLEIPIGAKVFSINNDKRRTNKAKVIDMQGETELSSWYNTNFKYHVEDKIEIKDFDEMYNVECSTGIHFFLTRKEAKNYEY